MRFILRQAILAHRWEKQLAEVIELCRRSGIAEVMLMEESHQIVMVPFPLSKHAQMQTIYQKMGQALRAKGIDYSINLATIVGHSDAPVQGDMVLPFTKFVGEDLVERQAVYCIGDPKWVDYAVEVVKGYAATHPKRLMIDDDFRSLNHSATTGCFCEMHAQKTAEALGWSSLSSAQLKAMVLEDSERGQSVKAAWQSVNFTMQLQAAQAMEQAIHAVDPTIEVGLMNSGEIAHSVQGRDMKVLLHAFAGPNRPILSRPAGGVYADGLHTQIINMHQMSALSRHAAGQTGVWISEVENWPHSRYLKSVAITKLQLYMHVLWGADALSLNVYDYLATPFHLEPDWENLVIAESAPLSLLQTALHHKQLRGVGLPWKADLSRHQRNRTGSLDDLYPKRPLDNLLPLLGIPVQFDVGEVNVVLGDEVNAYSDDELSLLLSRGLLIDNLAAQWLIERGFGSLLGGSLDGKLEGMSTERLSHPDFSGAYLDCDLPTNWFRMSLQGEWISQWNPHPMATVVSTFVDENGQALGAALTLYENAMGGRIAVMAQHVQELGWLHRGRAIQMQAILRWLGRDALPYPLVEEGPNIAPFVYTDPQTNQSVVALVNTGLDPIGVNLARLGLRETIDYQALPDYLVLQPLGLVVGS